MGRMPDVGDQNEKAAKEGRERALLLVSVAALLRMCSAVGTRL